jgi:hypothetical protein
MAYFSGEMCRRSCRLSHAHNVTRGYFRHGFNCVDPDGAVPREAVMTSSAAIIVLKYAKDLHAEWACVVECTAELIDVKGHISLLCPGYFAF